MQAEIAAQKNDVADKQKKIQKQTDNICDLKKELKAKEDALELQAGDKMRLKELSEGYMKEIAALEA